MPDPIAEALALSGKHRRLIGQEMRPSLAELLPDVQADSKAVAAGKARMMHFRYIEKLKAQHDYGRHIRNLWTSECPYCLGELSYQLRQIGSVYFVTDEIPGGFR